MCNAKLLLLHTKSLFTGLIILTYSYIFLTNSLTCMKNKCNPTSSDVGNNIRKWRLIKGHNQKLFSDQLDISIPALCKIETGKTDMNLSRLCGIAEVLEIDIRQLFSDPVTLIKN